MKKFFLLLCCLFVLNSCYLPDYTALKEVLNQTYWLGEAVGDFIAVRFGYGTIAVAVASSEAEAISRLAKASEEEYRIMDIDDAELSAVVDISGYGLTRIEFEYGPNRSEIEIYLNKHSSILKYNAFLRKYRLPA